MYTKFSPSHTNELKKEFKRIIREAKDKKNDGDNRLYSSKMRKDERVARKIAEKAILS
jgi:hypothetical protein